MDDVQVGSIFRAVRIRIGLSQAEVACAAGVSKSLVSLIERGHLPYASVGTVRDIAAALEISLPFAPRWRGPELARLLDEAHSGIVGATVEALRARGWQARPEMSFNRWGERGSIDVFAWRADRRAIATIECKSVVVDLQDLLSTMDRKRRLAPDIALEALGWRPECAASILVLPDSTAARNRVAKHAAIFEAGLPARTVAIRKWLEEPAEPLAGVWFLRYSNGSGRRGGHGGPIRVIRPNPGS